MPRRPTVEFDRHKQGETLLRRSQREVLAAKKALTVRDSMLKVLYERGYTQRQLLDLLNDEARRAGEPLLSEDAVQKAVKRLEQRG